jgi:AraC family transcriptional regulator, transcriptional activator of pobA
MAGRPATIPRFALYGEAPATELEALHIEDVASRSQRYGWEIEPHLHQGLHQALWLFAGEADVQLDEVRERVSGPAAILLPPGVAHGFKFSAETDGLVLTLSARFAMEEGPAGATIRRVFGARILRFSAADLRVARIDALFRELHHECQSAEGARSPAAAWLARALLWRLAEACGAAAGEGPTQALYARFLMLVERHFAEHWPLTHYAETLGLSTQRLNRLARSEGAASALEVIHARLTREACRRLYFIAAPAEKLALELGFEDPAYFSRFFKRRTGMSPRKWREAQRQGG